LLKITRADNTIATHDHDGDAFVEHLTVDINETGLDVRRLRYGMLRASENPNLPANDCYDVIKAALDAGNPSPYDAYMNDACD